ncbi:MAG: penicillin-binding protein 2 [Planctomycetes bacterium]|jgi:cell division protein FtsI (penicillin-binding protein 3)|nr:penicillin-binding protein 2 [Planctomycetota bacterium]
MQSSNAGNQIQSETAARGQRQLRKIFFFLGLVVLTFLGLAARCVYLQYCRADHFTEKSLLQQRSYLPLEPQRGAILDCRGRVLAASDQIRTVFAEPRIIKDAKETATRLAPILDMGAHEICKLIVDSNNPGYVVLKTGATEAECEAAQKIHGLGIRYAWRRNYPMGRLASHVVGFTSVDNRGIEGLECAFDSNLRGRGATRMFLVDVHRRPLRFCLKDDENCESPMHGSGLILTIDATLQQFVREALVRQFQEFQAEAASAIIADPQTGAILAMVSLPDYAPAEARHSDPRFFKNRLLADQFEPGSIIKPIVAAVALDTAVVNRYETIFCENGNYHGKGFGHIGEYRRGYGDLTLREILTVSSNIGMAKIGQRLGNARLYEGLQLFGFGKEVGLELYGEAAGMLRPPGVWTGYSAPRVAFGQEVSVTSIQMLRAFCLLANGGRLVWPHLVRAMVTADGTVVDMRPSQLRVGYVIKPEIARWLVTEALVSVVNDKQGTGTRARLDQWEVFGKTGTGQIAVPGSRGYQADAYTASFIGGAPAEDPRVIVLVSIRRPNVKLHKGYTGGTVAAPVAGVILEKTLTYLNVPPRSPDGKRKTMLAGNWPPHAPDPESENSW